MVNNSIGVGNPAGYTLQGIHWFDIFFDKAYGGVVGTPVSSWDEDISIEVTSGVFDLWDKYYDQAILKGSSLAGFSLSFTFDGSPATQYFELYDPNNDEVMIASGWTQPLRVTVPEPVTLLLLLPGLAALVALRRSTPAA